MVGPITITAYTWEVNTLVPSLEKEVPLEVSNTFQITDFKINNHPENNDNIVFSLKKYLKYKSILEFIEVTLEDRGKKTIIGNCRYV